MKKGWNITEKVISTILQAWALYYMYSFTVHVMDMARIGVQSGILTPGNINYGIIVKLKHVYYLLGLLTFFAGVALLYDKKIGWITSVATTALFAGFMLVSGRNGVTQDNNPQIMASVGYLIASFVFAVMFVVLMLKPIRQKYRPTFKSWLVIIGIVAFILLDKNVIIPLLAK